MYSVRERQKYIHPSSNREPSGGMGTMGSIPIRVASHKGSTAPVDASNKRGSAASRALLLLTSLAARRKTHGRLGAEP